MSCSGMLAMVSRDLRRNNVGGTSGSVAAPPGSSDPAEPLTVAVLRLTKRMSDPVTIKEQPRKKKTAG